MLYMSWSNRLTTLLTGTLLCKPSDYLKAGSAYANNRAGSPGPAEGGRRWGGLAWRRGIWQAWGQKPTQAR